MIANYKQKEKNACILRKDDDVYKYWKNEATKITKQNEPFYISRLTNSTGRMPVFKYADQMTKFEYVDTIIYCLKGNSDFVYEANFNGKGAVFWSIDSVRVNHMKRDCREFLRNFVKNGMRSGDLPRNQNDNSNSGNSSSSINSSSSSSATSSANKQAS